MRLELVIDLDTRIGGFKSRNDRAHDVARLPKTPIVDCNRFGFGANRGLWPKGGEDPAADKDNDADDDQTDEDGGKEPEGRRPYGGSADRLGRLIGWRDGRIFLGRG